MRLFFFILLILCLYDTHAQRDDFAHINFNKADKIAASLKGENLSNLPNLSYKLTAELDSEVEQFRSIYKWVCENIANDYNLYFQNKRKRDRFKNDSLKFTNWNAIFRKKLFRKLLKDQRTICTGYAYLVKELARFANLECEIVQGYGRVSTTDIENLELPNHSWNAIKLNNKWYLCDPTWASGIPDPESNIFTFNYNDGFFLANPALFAINHFPIEDKWWLMDDRIPTFENFLASPIIYGKAYKNLATHYLPVKMHHIIKETEKVIFRYELHQPISKNDIKFYIDSGYKQWKTEPTHTAIKGKLMSLEHQFNKKGFYDVHLYIDEDLISTYTVKVE
ncbi:transglutaminase domain-containing protein [Winogradskyella sp. PE311]|uniref:transglutaminase domain-containing protein n=1 Tax=Winogradskyella sp. PE311 TaxID=3366943 RepID=UPI003980E12F